MVIVLENFANLLCNERNGKVGIFACASNGYELELGYFKDMKYAKSVVEDILMYYRNMTNHPDEYSVYQIPYDIRDKSE